MFLRNMVLLRHTENRFNKTCKAGYKSQDKIMSNFTHNKLILNTVVDNVDCRGMMGEWSRWRGEGAGEGATADAMQWLIIKLY